MWIPSQVLSWFTTLNNAAGSASEALAYLREDLAAVRAERDVLRTQLVVAQTHFDWLRTRVNVLEAERVVLLDKAAGIKLAAPEFLRTSNPNPITEQNFSFEDLGDEAAKKFGLA